MSDSKLQSLIRHTMQQNKPLEVVVHPIVLLSVVDHYDRVAKGTSKRVVGTLLGEVFEMGDL